MVYQSKIKAFYNLAAIAGTSGILLLSRPLIYLIFSRRRDLNAYSSVDASAMVFILYAIICFFIATRELNQNNKTLGRDIFIHSPVLWIILYTFLGMASMLWSVNLQLTGFRAFECLSMIMLMIAIVQNLFIKAAVNW